jgi:hypothetical protein
MRSIQQHLSIEQLFMRACKPVLLLGALWFAAAAQAQVTVTSVTYGTLTNNTDTSHGGLTYREQYAPVNTVTTSLGDYRFDGPVASNVIVRRNTSEAGPNNTTVFYQTSASNSTAPLGQYESSVANMFLSNNLYEGLRNPFANGAGAQNSNIERLDFYYAGGYTVQANDALVFFDLENTGNFGDGFRIAAFTAVDGAGDPDTLVAGTPTTYANSGLMVAADSFGGPINSPSGGTSGNFERATYTNGDNLSGPAGSVTNIGSGLNLVGILIRFSDLGIAAGSTIQGFSLMAGDTAPTSAVDLVNWNNATYYPTNTDPTTYGNMDFMAFGATVSRPVPEPSAYGAILLGLTVALLGWRHRRARFSGAQV